MTRKKGFVFFGLIFLLMNLLYGTIIFADDPPATPPPVQLGTPVSQTANNFFRINYTGCGGVTAPVVNAGYEQQVLDLVNSERAQNGLPPLKRVDSLDASSRYHATDMAQDDYFYHESYDRVNGNLEYVCDTWDRVLNYYGSNWNYLAENIAAGYATPTDVMNAWMNSDGHRHNILSASVREIGIGYYEGGGTYYRYWVQDFGQKSSRYPIIINRDAATTTSQNVQLYIYGAGDFDEMRLRNNDGTWSAWVPFQSSYSWTMDGFSGNQTVSAEMRRGSSTATSSDTIYVDLPYPRLGGLPAELGFLYSRATGELLPAQHRITPSNTNTTESLNWQANDNVNWLSLSPTSGSTPGVLTVTPMNLNSLAPGTYNGTITVNVTNPTDTLDSPTTVSVRVVVVNTPLNKVFLPMIQR